MAQDTYHPAAPATAECPHCGATVAGAPSAGPTTLTLTLLKWTCPQCGRRWNEVGQAGVIARF